MKSTIARRLSLLACLLVGGLATAHATCLIANEDPLLCETREIRFRGVDAATLTATAARLGNAAAIYAYVRNQAEYVPYHGARSDSINGFGGLVGNDVDLASTLIALLRSQGVKARYVEGLMTIPKSQLVNWLRLDNTALLPTVLSNQGVAYIDNGNTMTLTRIWVEALVPYRSYRGAVAGSCPAESLDCRWLALDPSFKQKRYAHPELRMFLRNLTFDTNGYYNADNSTSAAYNATYKNKNPLNIFEENALSYLRANKPGTTLDDVADPGEIISDESGLLPASLPFAAIALGRYASVDDYDTTATYKWSKNLDVTLEVEDCGDTTHVLPSLHMPVAELATARLTFGPENVGGQSLFGFRLNGVLQGSAVSVGSQTVTCTNGTSKTLTAGTPLTVTLSVPQASPMEAVNTARYVNLVAGGYFVVATGSEVANRVQVQRAYSRLEAANTQYPLVVDTAGSLGAVGEVYVDGNGSGAADTGEVRLMDHPQARDALTGGLLEVAGRLYLTMYREGIERYGYLKNYINLPGSTLGLISTAQAVQYLDDTSFGIAPQGLLIDLKGLYTHGFFARESAGTISSEAFMFGGHYMSALEHEIWQRVTGFDAISTVRGFQTALGAGQTLLDLKRTSSSDPLPGALDTMGFKSTPPVGFTAREYALFGRNIYTWEYSGGSSATAGLNLIRGNASGIAESVLKAEPELFSAASNIQGFLKSYDNLENQLLAKQPTEGQLKGSISADPSSTAFSSMDVVSAVVSSPAGFGVTFNRTGASQYHLAYTETSQHADGTYNLVTPLYLATPGKTDYQITWTSTTYAYQLSSLVTDNPAFVLVSPIAPLNIPRNVPITLTFRKVGNVADSDTLVVRLKGNGYAWDAGNQQYLVANTTLFNWGYVTTRANRVVDSVLTYTLSDVDTSDRYTYSCNGLSLSGTPTQLLTSVKAQCFDAVISAAGLTSTIDFFDRNKGFNPALYLYRNATNLLATEYPVGFLKTLQTDLYGHDAGLVEYLLPTRMPQGENYLFNVNLRHEYYPTGNIKASTYAIQNQQ